MSEFEVAVLIGPEVSDYPKIHLSHSEVSYLQHVTGVMI
jgi:hypothetical protein